MIKENSILINYPWKIELDAKEDWCVRINIQDLNPLSANFTKWSNTLKQFVGNLPTTCLSVFGHFVGLALKGLRSTSDWPLTKLIPLTEPNYRKNELQQIFSEIKFQFKKKKKMRQNKINFNSVNER